MRGWMNFFNFILFVGINGHNWWWQGGKRCEGEKERFIFLCEADNRYLQITHDLKEGRN